MNSENHDDPYHPILERPWEYELFDLQYWQLAIEDEPFITLTLKNGHISHNLRFLNPVNIEIETGFPTETVLYIFDVSKRGIEGLNVRVDSQPGRSGAVRFWARDVIICPTFTR